MKKPLAALALAALLGGCNSINLNDPFGERSPAPRPMGSYPGEPGSVPRSAAVFFHAAGQEPGWTLDIDPREIHFSGPYGVGPVAQPTPRAINGFAGEIYQTPRINVNIVHGPCQDSMSGKPYPSKVQMRVDNRSYQGCGGPTDVASNPGPGPSGPLADSHWRVVSVNGRATPTVGEYRMDFTGDRVSARFGCNSFGGNYILDRDMMSSGPLMSTKMACAGQSASFESQGSAVLGLPARVRFEPGRLSLTNNAGIVELERR